MKLTSISMNTCMWINYKYVCMYVWMYKFSTHSEHQHTIHEIDPSFVMQHKFMFALQKNVNSPIRSSIAKVWLKFIENPLANAIFFQDSFNSRKGRLLLSIQSVLSCLMHRYMVHRTMQRTAAKRYWNQNSKTSIFL